jgi:hypothetical protein
MSAGRKKRQMRITRIRMMRGKKSEIEAERGEEKKETKFAGGRSRTTNAIGKIR